MIKPPSFGGIERPTSKVVLRDPTNMVVLVAETDDRLNLPGGKIESGETPAEALNRELEEELGITSNYLRDLESLGSFTDVVTPRAGDPYGVRWYVHRAQLLVPVRELIVGADIERLETRTPYAILAERNPLVVSRLARRAVRRSILR